MTSDQLKEYLCIVTDLEKNIFMMNRLEQGITQEINLLGQGRNIPRPIKKTPDLINDSVIEAIIKSIIFGGIIGGVTCYFFRMYFFRLFYSGNYVLDVFLGACIIASILYFISISIINGKKNSEKIQECDNDYRRQMEEYQKQVHDENTRLAKENKIREGLQRQLTELENQKAKVQGALLDIYSRDVIFPKYRNLTMVCSLYEYVCAGRCTQLEGHEGGYNILETEIRLDRIITQLDLVIVKLEAIRQNQFTLYSAIQESNQQTAELLTSNNRMVAQIKNLGSRLDIQSAEFQAQLSELQKSAELTAYYTQLNHKELQYMNRMDYLTGRNDGLLYNVPPT